MLYISSIDYGEIGVTDTDDGSVDVLSVPDFVTACERLDDLDIFLYAGRDGGIVKSASRYIDKSFVEAMKAYRTYTWHFTRVYKTRNGSVCSIYLNERCASAKNFRYGFFMDIKSFDKSTIVSFNRGVLHPADGPAGSDAVVGDVRSQCETIAFVELQHGTEPGYDSILMPDGSFVLKSVVDDGLHSIYRNFVNFLKIKNSVLKSEVEKIEYGGSIYSHVDDMLVWGGSDRQLAKLCRSYDGHLHVSWQQVKRGSDAHKNWRIYDWTQWIGMRSFKEFWSSYMDKYNTGSNDFVYKYLELEGELYLHCVSEVV